MPRREFVDARGIDIEPQRIELATELDRQRQPYVAQSDDADACVGRVAHVTPSLVPGVGIEPTWPRGRGILSPLRLPVSPSGRGAIIACCRQRRCKKEGARRRLEDGGRGRNRTGVRGFAIRCITTLLLGHRDHCSTKAWNWKRKTPANRGLSRSGAGKGARTLDLNLGKVAFYQLNYSRSLSFLKL